YRAHAQGTFREEPEVVKRTEQEGPRKVRSSGQGGQGERERRARADPALHPDPASLGFDESPGDGESEADALVAPGRLPESLPDATEVRGGNARARVVDVEANLRPGLLGLHRHGSTLRREPERVAEEVGEHLQDPVAIADGHGAALHVLLQV